MVSPFDLSQTLPVGGGVLVPCSHRTSCHKKLMQMVTILPGWWGVGGGVASVNVLPLTIPIHFFC